MDINRPTTLKVTTRNSSNTMDPRRHDTGHDLCSLPNEILLAIMSYSSRKTLYKFCLTSKIFNALAQPLMYQDYSQRKELRPFMRTLLARPDLASHVRHVEIYDLNDFLHEGCLHSMETGYKGKIAIEWEAWKEIQDTELDRLIRNIWMGFRESPPDDEVEDITTLCEKRLVLLLSLVPNLERLMLRLQEGIHELSPVVEHAMSSWGEDRRFLTKLTTLVVFYDEVEINGFCLSEIASFLYLPSLTTFWTNSCIDVVEFRPAPGSLPIQEILLITSVIGDKLLEGLIRACRTLKRLQLDYGEDCLFA